ncbi:hypothetical protein [Saccharomonospora sp. NB11]|jgi:hypothetical protein|uniref:hypothetical protein n=1 Tax=Saccharomonospora sp. NB11 TaxID=1642298 RepID=UPI0018D0D6AF|nr:hypothetical protein [Saccharomonospora sp. NB11]
MRLTGGGTAAVVAVLAGVMLAGCDEVTSAVEGVESAGDKAKVCTEALRIIDLNVDVSPESVAAGAEEKARELRELAEQVADQPVRDTLFDLANGYLELEQRKYEHLGNFSAWLERNLDNLGELREACF